MWSDLIGRAARWLTAGPSAASPQPGAVLPGSEFHDRRETAAQAHGPGGKWKVRGRALKDVTGVCLHQTACLLGERPERWDTVGAHFGVTRSGKVIWLHGEDRLVMHGNGWNAKTIGIEIDGLYAGVEGDPSTVWDDPSTPSRERGMTVTPEAMSAARELVRWLCTRNTGIKVLVAHRQSSKDRRNDPGSEIWRQVALPLHAELGLSDGGVGFEIGGYAVPESWDSRCKGVRY